MLIDSRVIQDKTKLHRENFCFFVWKYLENSEYSYYGYIHTMVTNGNNKVELAITIVYLLYSDYS